MFGAILDDLGVDLPGKTRVNLHMHAILPGFLRVVDDHGSIVGSILGSILGLVLLFTRKNTYKYANYSNTHFIR